MSQASLLLQKQFKGLCSWFNQCVLFTDLCKAPLDGFSAGFDESNVFEWNVTIIGPPYSLYDGGFFNAIMTFPPDYPNVYSDGTVCISILHPPGDDPVGYEDSGERWLPIHTVERIVQGVTK
ncbi:unnamed protein product [Vicia faba]|uniref:UBC core domain-containing protein n=1 Tax=Vicia faba TaxID=3906 RepID=A0AAV0ZUV3_VICFA|nr:unnamed protein product [Vicia faba]